MDRSRRQRRALQIDPSTAAAGASRSSTEPAIPEPPPPRHLEIRLQPRSRRNAVLGERDGALVIALQAAPVDGAANAALLRFLADQLQLPPGALTLVRGANSRLKWVAMVGLSVEEAHRRLLPP